MEMNVATATLEPQAAQPIPPPPTRPRCQYVSRTGKPCRYLGISAEKPFCKNHLPPPPPGSPEELAHTLKQMARNFDTPEGVNRVMHTLFFALVEGRITERKAGILTYMAQTILHSHRATAYWEKFLAEKDERKLEEERREGFEKLTWNLPRGDGYCESGTGKSDSECSAGVPVSAAGSGPANEDAGMKASTTVKNSGSADAVENSGSVHSVSSVVKADSDLNHFFPVDPTLPAHLQDPRRLNAPPASEAELDRHNRRFDRVHGFTRRGKQSYPTRESPDWKILNGR